MSTYIVEIEGPNPEGHLIGELFVDGDYMKTIVATDRDEMIRRAREWAAFERTRATTRETVKL